MDQVVLWQIGIGAGAFLLGLGAGLALRRSGRRLRVRVGMLEAELQEARRRYDQQRARVEKHFERTSELFGELTEQYTSLYSHLAEGARELCPEGGPALGRGLDDPLLAASFDAATPSETDAAEAETSESDAGADEPAVERSEKAPGAEPAGRS